MMAALAPLDVPTTPARSRPGDLSRLGAMAGIAYVVLVAVENLDIMASPHADSPVADVLAAYRTPTTRLVITGIAGIAALAAYAYRCGRDLVASA